MGWIELRVADNVTLKRDDRIYRAAETFTTTPDDETEQWLRHGYAEQVKAARPKATRKK